MNIHEPYIYIYIYICMIHELMLNYKSLMNYLQCKAKFTNKSISSLKFHCQQKVIKQREL